MASSNRTSGTHPSDPVSGELYLRVLRLRQATALVCGVAAILYGFALISYTPADVPSSWLPFGGATGTGHVVANHIGLAGALAAGCGHHLLGAASYLIPAVMLWLSFATLLGFAVWRPKTVVAGLIFLVSAACLIDLQPVFFQDWVERFNLPGSPGGLAGFALGQGLTSKFFGPVGSSVILLCLYLAGLLGLTGFRPIRFGDVMGPDVTDFIHHPRMTGFRPLPEPGNVPLLEDSRSAPPSARARTVRVIELDADPDDLVELAPQTMPGRRGGSEEGSGSERRAPVQPASRAPETVAVIPEEEEPDGVALDASEVDDTWDDLGAASVPGREKDVFAEAPLPTRPAPRVIDTVGPRRARTEARPVLSAPSKAPRSFSSHGGRFGRYELPSIDILDCEQEKSVAEVGDTAGLLEIQQIIIETLKTFGLIVSPGDITRGPTITRYEIYPSVGQSVKRIAALEADLARATRAERINILAPIPGRDTVGIEIANQKKVLVPLRELLEDPRFTDGKAQIPLALGKDVYGEPLVADLAAMPHLLVAGATGSGKSVCINSIIVSLLCRFSPEELRFIMIDPKVVEMQMYKDLPHLAVPVVTSPKKVLLALRWCLNEMERRYELFAEAGCRKLEEYNNRHLRQQRRAARKNGTIQPELFAREELGGRGAPSGEPGGEEGGEEDGFSKLPFIVVIIDELADLMQTAPAEVETAISRLCQKARASGIHLIVATQSPRVDVVTGLIKANIPSRIAFQVASATDSRVILDRAGADRLVGKGDMLYQPPDSPVMVRAQGAFVTDDEVQDIVEHCASQATPAFDPSIHDHLDGSGEEDDENGVSDADEEILDKCIEVILAERKASTSFLQRRLRLGYTRAARMMDILQERGIVGPGDGAKPREILIAPDEEIA